MPYAVYLDLDLAGSHELDRLIDHVEELDGGISTPRRLGFGHHLTLAVYDELDASQMQRTLAEELFTIYPLELVFSSIGSFPSERSVLFAAPTFTNELLSLHEQYHEVTASLGHGQIYYHPGSWCPHVTIALDLSRADLANAFDAVSSQWTPIRCQLDAIRLVRFYPVETLWLGPLAKR
jgi:2'-5' RNA ligase